MVRVEVWKLGEKHNVDIIKTCVQTYIRLELRGGKERKELKRADCGEESQLASSRYFSSPFVTLDREVKLI